MRRSETGGIAIPLNWLQGSPFVGSTIPGLALAIIVGGSWLLVALSLQAFFFALGLAIFVLAATPWMVEFRSRHFPVRHISHA